MLASDLSNKCSPYPRSTLNDHSWSFRSCVPRRGLTQNKLSARTNWKIGLDHSGQIRGELPAVCQLWDKDVMTFAGTASTSSAPKRYLR